MLRRHAQKMMVRAIDTGLNLLLALSLAQTPHNRCCAASAAAAPACIATAADTTDAKDRLAPAAVSVTDLGV